MDVPFSSGGAPIDAARPAPVYPPGTRVLAGALAILLLGYLASRAPGLALGGYWITLAMLPLVTLPFVALFGLLAAVPPRAQRVLDSGGVRVDLRDPGAFFALLVLAMVLFLVFGAGAILDGVETLEAIYVKGRGVEELSQVTSDGLYVGLILNLVLLTVPVVLWLAFARDVPVRHLGRALGLREERAGRAFGIGLAAGVGGVMLVAVFGLALHALGKPLEENVRAVAIASAVTVPGALLVAAASSFSEEVFFRGFLQPRVGVLAQAVLFSLAHLSYAHVMELVVTFSLGVAFALLYRRTGNLWAPIGAHFAFNLVMLLMARIAAAAESMGS